MNCGGEYISVSVCESAFLITITGEGEESHMEREKNPEEVKENEGEEKREGTRSRSSSTSSEDYIIILPDCFDTSRPLGESMYRYVTSAAVAVQFVLSWKLKNSYTYNKQARIYLIYFLPFILPSQLCSVPAW